jgi:hypothetical protein
MTKSVERNLYIEVEDTDDGDKILSELVSWLCDLKYRYPKAYLNGWIGPVKETKKRSKKTKKKPK